MEVGRGAGVEGICVGGRLFFSGVIYLFVGLVSCLLLFGYVWLSFWSCLLGSRRKLFVGDRGRYYVIIGVFFYYCSVGVLRFGGYRWVGGMGDRIGGCGVCW